ncbi:hypothetical protein AVEN_20062-1 [Araneus ventricosus]|uniref:Uncharacterized protein n=1 Tax=Araneus ventricosus TaxID=182803 RepID=A0A4Y2JX94_ARAVE|nr:hypothetical protein AVEN_20062-1 [Araneus ventricosus]
MFVTGLSRSYQGESLVNNRYAIDSGTDKIQSMDYKSGRVQLIIGKGRNVTVPLSAPCVVYKPYRHRLSEPSGFNVTLDYVYGLFHDFLSAPSTCLRDFVDGPFLWENREKGRLPKLDI